jgi:hypothetical protein
MQYVNVPMSGMMAPSQADVLKVLACSIPSNPCLYAAKRERTEPVR